MKAKHKRVDSFPGVIIFLTILIIMMLLSSSLYEDLMGMDFESPCRDIEKFHQECQAVFEDCSFDEFTFTWSPGLPERTFIFVGETTYHFSKTTYLSQPNLNLRC